MTEIERKALELTRKGIYLEVNVENMNTIAEAYRNLHERHEAFRQEVSDAINDMVHRTGSNHGLYRFMLPPKLDPLVEAMNEWQSDPVPDDDYTRLRAALAKRGLEIREKSE